MKRTILFIICFMSFFAVQSQGEKVLCPVDAGADGTLVVCKNDSPKDLFLSLVGNPDPGGTWSPALSGGAGVFDPTIDISGNYFYTVGDAICGFDSAAVSVSIIDGPDAGDDALIELCEDDAAVDLFILLEGMPDSGGTWAPPLASGASIFNPSVDVPGVYTYTVGNAICEDNSSTVTIVFTSDVTIENYDVVVTDFAENNTIEITIVNPENYQFTLNGIIQSTPFFENLIPGSYTLIIEEIDGCGYLQTTVNVRGYQLFFTPNGDGYFDTWKALGFGNQNFEVKIFDRYGKLLKVLNQNVPSWDGIYQGSLMPNDDYWFSMEYEGGQFLGHFSLKR